MQTAGVVRARRLAWATLCASLLLAGTGGAALAGLDEIKALRDAGRFEEALVVVGERRATFPGDADLALFQGQLLGYLGRYDAALAALAEAEALAPDYADVHRAQIRIRFYRASAATPIEDGALLPVAGSPDANAYVQGRLALRAGLHPEARAAFERVVANEPAYAEAWLALGDAAREQGDTAASRVAYETALDLPGADSAAAMRLRALAQQHWTWLVGLSGSASRVEGGEPWAESYASLTRRLGGGRLVGASYETARRYDDKIDTHVALNLTQRFTPKTAGFVALGVTPAADFLPTWRAKAGVEHELRPGNGRLGGTVGSADVTLADYDAGLARTLGLGLTQYTADGVSWGTVRLTGGFDPEGRLDFGASLRLDHQIDDRNRVYLGVARESDAERYGAIDRDTIFTGYRRDLSDHVTLDLSLGYETPDRGRDRQSFTAGLTLRFD